jgi:nicotinate-nucleotide adenylyltransferase
MDTFAPCDFAGAWGILGGTFDPIHWGHVRMAVEAKEALGLERVILVPSFVPPHKAAQSMLPYVMRRALARAACRAEAGLAVSDLERSLSTPSYTVRTVAALRQLPVGGPWVFILGSTDFVRLGSWHQGINLPHLVHLVIVERPGVSWIQVDQFAQALGLARTSWGWRGKRCVVYLQPPSLEISSTLIRQRFVARRSLAGLVPSLCRDILESHRTFIERLWRQEDV